MRQQVSVVDTAPGYLDAPPRPALELRHSLSLAAAAVVLWASVARADPTRPRGFDPELTSETTAQFYEMRSPSGQTVISRRRLTTTLGLAAYDLLESSADPHAPTLVFRARLRYDADYGGTTAETDPRSRAFVAAFDRGPADLMYGYVEGRHFFNGVLDFRLGRQYVTDALGWWSFDGGLAKVTTPFWLALEFYGGLEQRGGLPFSTNRYERDGVWRGDRTDYDRLLYPSFQESDVAPAIGAAVESTGLSWIHARATYRRVYNTATSNLSQFVGSSTPPASIGMTRISSERVGYAIDATVGEVGGVKAGFAYDLYARKMGNIYASLDWYARKTLTVSLDYDFYQPTFDADSIWNFFLAMPMNDLALRAAWDPSRHIGIAGGLHGRLFQLQTAAATVSQPTAPNAIALDNVYPSSGVEPMGGMDLSARYRFGEGSIGVRGALDVAKTGDRLGLDVYGERTLETRYVFQARTGVWHWSDEQRASRDATTFGYVLGAGYRVSPKVLFLTDFQHDMNRIGGQRFRSMVWLSIALSNARGN